jgi:hypothetical protein
MKHVEAHVADLQRVTAPEQYRAILLGERVFPVRIPFVGEVELGPGSLRKLPSAGYEVGVNVRLRHVRELQPLLLGPPDVLVHVTVRVDHQRLTRRLATD